MKNNVPHCFKQVNDIEPILNICWGAKVQIIFFLARLGIIQWCCCYSTRNCILKRWKPTWWDITSVYYCGFFSFQLILNIFGIIMNIFGVILNTFGNWMNFFDKCLNIFGNSMIFFDKCLNIFGKLMNYFDKCLNIFGNSMNYFDKCMNYFKNTLIFFFKG